jgi:hypothetical protein
MNTGSPATASPIVRRLVIKRFRGIEKLTWCPEPGVNIILGGGDVGKSTILDALALLFNPNSTAAISDSDFWKREAEPDGFEIEAVMSLPDSSRVHTQSKQSSPWGWDGTTLSVPSIDDAGTVTVSGNPAFCLRASANADVHKSRFLHQTGECQLSNGLSANASPLLSLTHPKRTCRASRPAAPLPRGGIRRAMHAITRQVWSNQALQMHP